MKWVFIVFFIYICSLFFREERLPASVCNWAFRQCVPTNVVVCCEEIGFCFRSGLRVQGLKFFEAGREKPTAWAEEISISPLRRLVRVVGARYPRLPESYYLPGNQEKNARVEAEFPAIPKFTLVLVDPDILSAHPARIETFVMVEPHRIVFDKIHLDWREKGVSGLDGFCTVDLDKQEILGEVDGHALQLQIRPLLVALDVPVSLPYMDGFTEVPEQVKSWCGWKVNLVNNDFDLSLELHPILGKYNGVRMKKADGRIHLHSYTRGTWLNYQTTVGPIAAVSPEGRPLTGTVVITGTNGYNVVRVDAQSALPLADILKIGGFTGEYVTDKVIGETTGSLEFRFPRSMTNNYEVLNGEGHVVVKNGHLMRLNLFAGLTKLLADHVPGVSFLVDQSEATADYRIENGVVKSDNIAIEGGVISIKMSGSLDTTKDKLDFIVRVRFTKDNSLMGKYFIRPVTWPFSKLLLEFRLTGSTEKPKWEYISILDRVMDIIK